MIKVTYNSSFSVQDISPSSLTLPMLRLLSSKSIRMKRFLKTIQTLSCWYSLESSPWAFSDECPCARVPLIFRFFASFQAWNHYRHLSYSLFNKFMTVGAKTAWWFWWYNLSNKKYYLENIWMRIVHQNCIFKSLLMSGSMTLLMTSLELRII